MTPAPGHDTVRDNDAIRDDNAAQFGSSLVAMVTPMRPDGRVNQDAAGRLADHLLAAGCDGLVVAGTWAAPGLHRGHPGVEGCGYALRLIV